MTKSRAQLLHEYLSSQSNGLEFYSSDLMKVMASKDIHMSYGMITGFLYRATERGMVERVAKAGYRTLYRLVDRTVVWRFNPSTKGSRKGRTLSSGPRVKLPQLDAVNTDNLSTRIFNIAAEVEKLENRPLSWFSTDELLEEIKRRMS